MSEFETESQRKAREILDNVLARQNADPLDEAYSRRTGVHLDGRPAWTAADVRESLVHGALMAAGHAPGDLHPLAEQKFEGGRFTLHKLVDGILELQGRSPLEMSGPEKIRAIGSTSDLPTIIAEVANVISRARSSRGLERLIGITSAVQLPNFMPAAYVQCELDDLPQPTYTSELKELPHIHVAASGESVQVASSAILLLVSRQLLTNGDIEPIIGGIQGYVASAIRQEWRLFSETLNANGTLQDGVEWFHSSKGNLITGAGMDPAGLGAARLALRTTPSESGEPTDAEAFAILCSPEDEQGALALAEALPDSRPLQVVSTAFLATGRWFLLADPEQHSTIGRVTLLGTNGESIGFEYGRDRIQSDASGFRGRHDVGFAPLGRPGIVACDKA
jgi:hypothetical protein